MTAVPTAPQGWETPARFLVGDVFDRMAELPDGSVDLVVTSPPFLAAARVLELLVDLLAGSRHAPAPQPTPARPRARTVPVLEGQTDIFALEAADGR